MESTGTTRLVRNRAVNGLISTCTSCDLGKRVGGFLISVRPFFLRDLRDSCIAFSGNLPLLLAIMLEDDVYDIIDRLETDDGVAAGLAKLDLLLVGLIPSIKIWRKTGIKPQDLFTFTNLQDRLDANIASSLLPLYRRFQYESNSTEKSLILTTNRCLQGLLLVHPASRKLFRKSLNMKLILTMVNQDAELMGYEIAVSLVSLLIHILLRSLQNFRVFEQNNGCAIVIEKLQLTPSLAHKSPSHHQQDLNFKIIEFLVFYLVDETGEDTGFEPGPGPRLTVENKADLFRPFFVGIDDLIDNLNDLNNL